MRLPIAPNRWPVLRNIDININIIMQFPSLIAKPLSSGTYLHQEMELLTSPVTWDLLKAYVVAYVEYPAEAFALRMAGKALSFIKAWSSGGDLEICKNY